jgi:hypothetical protein
MEEQRMSTVCNAEQNVRPFENRVDHKPNVNPRPELGNGMQNPGENHQAAPKASDLVQAKPESAETDKTYDIYLTKQCGASPEFGHLLQEVPALADPALIARISQWKAGGPGFLGLNLSRSTARAVLQRLKQARACGVRLASAYREPKITREQATPIAEQAMAELLQRERYRSLTFEPLVFQRRDATCWIFCAPCPEWLESDRVPGVLHVSVDRLDGHVWQYEEFEELHDADLPHLPLFPLASAEPEPARV